MDRVMVKPELFRWACERAGFEPGALAERFPRLDAWQRGEAQPTLKQLESFAQATYTPVGYLFLPEPPVEEVPIPDFRTMGNERLGRPSADLLDTIYGIEENGDLTGARAQPWSGPLMAYLLDADVFIRVPWVPEPIDCAAKGTSC